MNYNSLNVSLFSIAFYLSNDTKYISITHLRLEGTVNYSGAGKCTRSFHNTDHHNKRGTHGFNGLSDKL